MDSPTPAERLLPSPVPGSAAARNLRSDQRHIGLSELYLTTYRIHVVFTPFFCEKRCVNSGEGLRQAQAERALSYPDPDPHPRSATGQALALSHDGRGDKIPAFAGMTVVVYPPAGERRFTAEGAESAERGLEMDSRAVFVVRGDVPVSWHGTCLLRE